MTDSALSHALVPPLDHETKNWKTFIFLYIEQTSVASCFNALLWHHVCETAAGYFFWYNGRSTEQLHSRTVAPKQKNKKFVFKSVKNANFWRKYKIILQRKNLPIWDPNLPLRNPKSPYLALKKISHVWHLDNAKSKESIHELKRYGSLKNFSQNIKWGHKNV